MFFPLLGFSINVLSLLGLVLAIGIVVDDAIVVVEAVMHHIEHGLSPKEATVKAMEEVSGPVVAIVRPGDPGGLVRLPLRRHPVTEFSRSLFTHSATVEAAVPAAAFFSGERTLPVCLPRQLAEAF